MRDSRFSHFTWTFSHLNEQTLFNNFVWPGATNSRLCVRTYLNRKIHHILISVYFALCPAAALRFSLGNVFLDQPGRFFLVKIQNFSVTSGNISNMKIIKISK